MKITNEMIAAAELKLAKVLSMWHYEMPRDGMEQVLSAALQSVVTEEMVENACRAAYPGWDEIIREAERVWKRKQMHSALAAALQSAADTPPSPYAHAASTQTVKSLCELHDKLLRALDEKVGFKMFWANEMSDMASLILDAATELDKAFRQAPSPQPRESPLPPSKVREE
ncbi:hypothetical protein ABCW43_00350 [Neorhizobium sp. IRAMC:178]|uniref:hypothetical protein n=1 Tax=Neorhizobium tunisiense TaxID=3144793 RepID=UPI0031F70A5A